MEGFPAWVRKIIFRNGKGVCAHCGARWDDGYMLECDHIVPKGNGGSNDPENGQLLCRSCHARKHQQYSVELRRAGDIKGANAHAYWARQIARRDPYRTQLVRSRL